MAYTDQHLYFDDLEVGREWESPGRTVTAADVVNFAGLSGDFNPIHVDWEFARKTPFRQPIAHGLLVLAISSGLGSNAPAVRTLAFLEMREWQFKGPVFLNDTVRMRSRVVAKAPGARGRRGIVTWLRQIVNQEGKVVQEGTTLTLVEGRGATRPETRRRAGEADLAAQPHVTPELDRE